MLKPLAAALFEPRDILVMLVRGLLKAADGRMAVVCWANLVWTGTALIPTTLEIPKSDDLVATVCMVY